MRKFRKLKEMCTVVDGEDRVLFAFDLQGRRYIPSLFGAESRLYKYETIRKRNELGMMEWVGEKRDKAPRGKTGWGGDLR